MAVCNETLLTVEKISPRAGIELGPLDQEANCPYGHDTFVLGIIPKVEKGFYLNFIILCLYTIIHEIFNKITQVSRLVLVCC